MKKQLLLLCSALLFLGTIPVAGLFVVPEKWPKPAYNFTRNPLTAEKVTLGKVLFYDPALSRDNTVSCASCHSSFSAFTHIDHALSHGIEDRIGTRNAPALMNLAWQQAFMWDGAINHLDMQALAPISHPDEMGSSMAEVAVKLSASPLYPDLFYKAYGDSTVTGEKILKALSQFQLTLVSANSRYDQVMRKEKEFTTIELKGYRLFQKHCASCHQEPLFTNNGFASNGLPPDTALRDTGRMGVTGKAGDYLKFKVPTLRNIEYTYPYMHDGRFKKLSEVLQHYSTGIQPGQTVAPQLARGIALSSDEKTELTAFLLTLSDREFVFNPRHQFPKEIFLRAPKEKAQLVD